MTRCESTRAQLDAYLDRSLDAEERSRIDQHLDACASCRSEHEALVTIRYATECVFARDIADAPAPSAAFLRQFHRSTSPGEDRSEKRRIFSMTTTTLTGLGLAASLLFTFSFWPLSSVGATPAELLRRASERYQRHRDLEFRITPRSEAVDLLGSLLSSSSNSEENGEKQDAKKNDFAPFRLILGAPNRLLIDPDATDSRFELVDEVAAFDGENAWSYDAETDTITLSDGPILDLGNTTLDLGGANVRDADLMAYLSWGFVRGMSEASQDAGSVKEVTGPYERRIGHRAFEFDLRAGESSETANDKKIVTVTVRVVIDPRTDLLEKAEFDVGLGGLSLFNLRCELVGVNRGFDDSLFRFLTHVGENTRIVRREPKDDTEKTD